MNNTPDDKGLLQEIKYEGKFVRYVKKGRWEYCERTNCSGLVIIIAMTDNKEVVFVEQFRPPVNKQVIEFPAGLVNDKYDAMDESLEDAAKRELLEETGFEAQSVTVITAGPVSAGLTSDEVTIVHAKDLKQVKEGGGDETESITTHVVPLAQVEDWLVTMRQKGLAVEPKIYAGLYFLNKYNEAS